MTVLSAAPDIDVISARARQAKPGRVLLTLLAAVLFGLGWSVRKLFAVIWLGGAWTWFAIDEGWRAASAAESAKAPGRRDR
jgi:hypothetical protein